ncbi:MAG: DNA mismatch repair protein MutS [Planctomycetota bacterium]
MGDPKQTPAMKQYFRFKEQHPDCVLLFRMGDFYELFFEDAETVAGPLGLTLTQRTGGVPLAGVPHHQLDNYLRKLVALGYRVAIADQIQDPKDAKGVVDRAVTQVVTPGTLVDDGLLDGSAVNRLAALHFTEHGDASPASVAVVEASTGDLVLFDASAESLTDELASRRVKEILYAETATGEAPPRVLRVLDALGISGTGRPAWQFRRDEALEAVLTQFDVSTLEGFGLAADDPAVYAAGAVIRYLRETKAVGDEAANNRPGSFAAATLAHLRSPRREHAGGRCVIDSVSLRSLEIEQTIREGAAAGSLVGLFLTSSGGGGCRTAMGKRLVRDWLCRPSGELATIESRHARVAALVEDRRLAREIGETLAPVQDIARIAGRVALGRCSPRDIAGLGQSIGRVRGVAGLLDGTPAFDAQRASLLALAETLEPVAERITRECTDDPPAHLRDGGVFRTGIDPELDEARSLQSDASAWLARYQATVATELGLPGIKVAFNKVFGYYVELSAAQARDAKDKIDAASMTRKQTLKNAERFITPELKTFEEKVLRAEGRALERERELFALLVASVAAALDTLLSYADAIAELDAVLAFADRAAKLGWTRPSITDERVLVIEEGRHPVLEDSLGGGFVPNSVSIGGSVAGLSLITGPNMAGKSTFIRQVALITVLAHAGSFVPAASATIGLCDRVFTRVGADDALHRGQSTFMVEMIETANILNNATPRSLVILDEIGRGTSTLDGLSLAWAIVEALAGDAASPGPRTLFATHYHELTDLEQRHDRRVANLHVAVREWTPAGGESEIVFLHTVKPGRADQSYGVQVARLAGVPRAVTDRARHVLDSLAVQHGPAMETAEANAASERSAPQLSLFTEIAPHPAVDRLREVNLEECSPMIAFDLLRELRGMVETGDAG